MTVARKEIRPWENPDDLPLGTEVEYNWDQWAGPSRAMIIGHPNYADSHSHVMLATEDFIGMPIGCIWVRPTGNTNGALAEKLRNRYLSAHPGTLKVI